VQHFVAFLLISVGKIGVTRGDQIATSNHPIGHTTFRFTVLWAMPPRDLKPLIELLTGAPRELSRAAHREPRQSCSSVIADTPRLRLSRPGFFIRICPAAASASPNALN